MAAQLSPDGKRSVWLLPQPDTGVAALTQPDGLACSVYLQRGDSVKLTADFVSLIEGVARPGVVVKKAVDWTTGATTNLTYRVYAVAASPGSADRAFSITINAAPNASMVAILTAAAVQHEDP